MSAPSATQVLMDRVYRRQRFIYDITRKNYLLGRDRLIRALDPAPGESALEIGCGTARNLIVAARLYPGSHFYGIDISTAMLRTASANVARAGLSDRISLAAADAADFDPNILFGRPVFDRVFMSYTISMIPRWKEALDLALRVTAPDGRLHLVDFGEQQGLPGWFRKSLRIWLSHFHVEPRKELQATLHSMCAAHGAVLSFASLYRDYAIEARAVIETR